MSKFAILLFSVLALTLSSCDTMKGVGKDLKSGGEKLEKSAEANKPSNNKKHSY